MEENLWYYTDEQDAGDEVFVKEYDITSVPNDFNMLTIHNFIESGIVKIPDFQRNYVWDLKRASKLIESIILGLPIPQVFFYESEKNQYLIIDGQQRLLSIYFFIKGRFPKLSSRNILREEFEKYSKVRDEVLFDDNHFVNFTLKLDNVDTLNPYNKKNYATIDEDKKSTFQHMRTMRSIIIKQNAPDDSDSSMYEIFNRLNTGGQNLQAQEIRASLFHSPFYQMLYDLNAHPTWRSMLDKDEPDVHSKDIEFLLRSFMLLVYYRNYKPSMTKALNKFSKEAKMFDNDKITYFKDLFISFLSACDTLPTDAFRVKNRFNISRFDAVFAATCRIAFEKRELVLKKIDKATFDKLNENVEFSDASQSATASKRCVDTRIEIASNTIALV